MTTMSDTRFSGTARSTFSLTSLRSRAARHPMGLFAVAALVTAVSISMPSARALSVTPAPVPASQAVAPAVEIDAPRPATEVDSACSGQAWGMETEKCLVAIAKDGGKDGSARIRTISGV